MKKVLVMVALVMVSVIVYAFNDRAEAKQGKKEVTGNNGEVVVMNKEMFLKDVFDYEKSKEWIQRRQACHYRFICRLVWTLPPNSSYYERIGKRICRENCNLQSKCR